MTRASADVRSRPSRRKLTVADRVLVSLAHAAAGTRDAVPYEEIVIESWKRFPARFSLRRHPEHPDSEAPRTALYDRLAPAGLVTTLGDKMFRLTEKGLARASALDEALSNRVAEHDQEKIGRLEERLLATALSSSAFAKWQEQRTDELVDFDARLFFGITVTTSGEERTKRVQAMMDAADAAIEAERTGGVEIKDLATYLGQRFPEVTGTSLLATEAE